MSDGLPPELRDAHRPAVAAQHEQRHAEVGPRERLLDVRRRPFDDGEDARVDRGADRARLEAVGAAQLVARAHRQPTRARTLGDRLLERRVVDRERAAHGDRRAPGASQPLERGVEVAVQARGVERLVLGLERAAGGELDRADLRPLSREPELVRVCEADDADPRDVSLEQCVHRLRRREGHELDARAVVSELRKELVERLGDAACDALGRLVRCRHRGARAKLERAGLDRDGLRERAADVDPDAQPAGHALAAASSERRRSGRHANMYAAPVT